MEVVDISSDDVSFEVGKKEDGTLWHAAVSCKTPLTEKEFAAALLSLAHDILDDKVSFDDCPDVDSH